MIDDLPSDVLVLIFSRFNLLDKLKLRLVCSKWKQIIEGFRVKEVSIVDQSFNKGYYGNCFGAELVNFENLVYSNTRPPSWPASLFISMPLGGLTGSLSLVSKHRMFSRVKSMFLARIRGLSFEGCINRHFPHLEQLSCFQCDCRQTRLVSLPNLRVFSFVSSSSFSHKIRLELPRMYKFLTRCCLSSFEFVYPQSVTHLLSKDHESAVQFPNLEYFACIEFHHGSVILFNLPNLKEIDLCLFKHISIKRKVGEEIDKREEIVEIMEDEREERFADFHQARKRFGREELKMFVNNIDYRTSLNYHGPPSKLAIESYMSGKFSTKVLPVKAGLIYDELLDAFAGQMPVQMISDFKLAFPYVRIVMASSKTRDNVDSFFKFLDFYPNIYRLVLEWPSAGLGDQQARYRSLPSRCPYLRRLEIYTRDQTTPIDLDFVSDLNYLQMFETNLNLKAGFVRLLFEKLRYFRILEFSTEGRIQIEKTKNFFHKNSYALVNGQWSHTFYSLSRLLLALEQTAEPEM